MGNKKKHFQKKFVNNKSYEAQNKSELLPDFKKRILFISLIVIITFIAYIPSLNNEFVNWDDDKLVTSNLLIRDLNFSNIKAIFSSFVFGNYHPLTIFLYAIEYHFVQYDPVLYHWVNLIIHLLNTVFVFVFINMMSRRLEIAFVTAFLFGVHPLGVESVAWIADLKNVLFTLPFLAALITYIKYLKSKSTNNRYLFYTIIFYILSVLSKATAVSLPVLLFLFDYYYGRSFNKKIIIEKIPFFLFAFMMGIISLIGNQSEEAIAGTSIVPIVDRIFLSSHALLHFLLKSFIPFSMSIIHPHPERINSMLPVEFYFMPVIVIALVYLVYKSLKNTKVILFGSLFFLINIFLFLQLLPTGPSLVAERYSYIPNIGIFFLIGCGVSKIISEKSAKSYIIIPLYILLFCYGSYLTILTWQTCKVWKNSGTLWDNAISHYPRIYFAYSNRGDFKRLNNDFDGAIKDFKKSISIKPTFVEAYNNLAIAYYYQNNYDSAVVYFSRAIKINPDFAFAYNNRGGIYLNQGKSDLAFSDFNRAIKLMPNYAEPYLNRSMIYRGRNEFQKALTDAYRSRSLGYTVSEDYIKSLKESLK